MIWKIKVKKDYIKLQRQCILKTTQFFFVSNKQESSLNYYNTGNERRNSIYMGKKSYGQIIECIVRQHYVIMYKGGGNWY